MLRVHSLRVILIALGLLVIIGQSAIASAASQVYLTVEQAVSPYGGGQIAFTSSNGSLTTHVFLINPDGTNLRQVSFDPDCKVAYLCSDKNPSWSPDGRYIAFLSGQDKQSRTTIEVVNLSNGKQITLTTHVFSFGPPAWVPNGKSLSFTSDQFSEPDHLGKAYTVGVDGSKPQKLLDLPGSAVIDPVWSPDGRHIVFAVLTGDADKWVISDPDGTNQRVIKPDPTFVLWSPDGTALLIGRAGEGHMSIISASDESQQSSLDIPSDTYPRSWSPDGQSILLQSSSLSSPYNKLYVVDIRSKAVREITSQPADYRYSSWSPNSKYVVVEADFVDQNSPVGIYIINVENKSMQKLLGEGNSEPAWSANANSANEVLPTVAPTTPIPGRGGNSSQSAHVRPK